MSIPYQCTHLVCYEYLQKKLNPAKKYDAKTHIISGGVAGAVAAAVTTPFDVAKTLLNTQELSASVKSPGAAAAVRMDGSKFVVGLMSALKTIYAANGLMGYSKGLTARVTFAAPSTAISWSVYEFIKHYIVNRTDA